MRVSKSDGLVFKDQQRIPGPYVDDLVTLGDLDRAGDWPKDHI